MKDEFGSRLLGVLWTGSRAYGEFWPNSDWDFFVIHTDLWRQRRIFKVSDSTIELFIAPPDQIRREFSQRSAATLGMFARGQVVWDAQQHVRMLQETARQLWQEGPPAWTDWQRDQWRYAVADLLKDIEDILAEDPDAAAYLMGLAAEKVVSGFYQHNAWWEPKAKYLLADLALRHPEVAFQFRMIVSGRQSLTARYQALCELADMVQHPMGGYLTFWHTEPEEVLPWNEEGVDGCGTVGNS